MKRSFLQATLASNMKLGPPPPPPPPPQGAIPKSLEEAVYLATKRAETAMRAANHAARAATGAASAAREGLKLNKKACKKANPPPPSPSQPPANTFLPKMPFAYQLEVLEGMEASMRTTFTTKRKEMATQMMATPSAGTSFEDPIYLGAF